MDIMAHRRIALALLVVFLGASALVAEARVHVKFDASSYYGADEKPAAAPKELTDTSEDPNNRYPDGYPTTEHHWNKVTEKYDDETLPTSTTEKETVSTNTTTDTAVEPSKESNDAYDPNNRYPDGYPTTEHHWNKVTEKYDDETLPTTTTEKDTNAAQTVDPLTFDSVEGRYPQGYHPHSSYHTESTTVTTGEDLTHRYEKGYYPSSNGGTTFAAQNSKQQTTGEDLQHRYEKGYYGQSSNGGTNLAAQTLPEGDLTHRYEKGYYPNSDYTQNGLVSQPKSVASYSSYMGNFQSMPYPSSGVPFVASGAGCRTAYWAENPDVWPSFFTVKSTVGDAFGSEATSTYGETTILQALLKYGSDPYSELLRSGCTALLNSYTRGRYPVSHIKVISLFNNALASKAAATAQALSFEKDNVESISAGNACT